MIEVGNSFGYLVYCCYDVDFFYIVRLDGFI